MSNVNATLALGAVLKSGSKATFDAIAGGLKAISKELQLTAKEMLKMGKVDAADAVGHVGNAIQRVSENFTSYAKTGKEATKATKSMIAPMKDMSKQLQVVQDAWAHYEKTSNKTEESTRANAKFVKAMATQLGDLSNRFNTAGLNQDKWLKSLSWSNVQQAMSAKQIEFTSGRMRILGEEGMKALNITGKFATAYNKFSKDQSIYNQQLDAGSKISAKYVAAVRELGRATGYNNEVAKAWAPVLGKVNSAINTYAADMSKSSSGSKRWILDTNMASVAQQVLAKNIEVTSKGFRVLNEKGLSAFKGLSYEAAKSLGMLSKGFAQLSVKEGTASLTAYGRAQNEAASRSEKFRGELDKLVKQNFGVSRAFQTRFAEMKRTDDLWRKHTSTLQQAGVITTDTMHKMNAAFNANTIATKDGATGYQALSQALSRVSKEKQSLAKVIDIVNKETKISKADLESEAAALKRNGASHKEVVDALRQRITTQNEIVKSYRTLEGLETQRAKITGKSVDLIRQESRAKLDQASDEKSYAMALKEAVHTQKQQLATEPQIAAKKREVSKAIQDLNLKYRDLITYDKRYVEGLRYVAQEYQRSSFAGRQAARDLDTFAKSTLAAKNELSLFGKVTASVVDHLKSFSSYAAAATIIAGITGAFMTGADAIMEYDQALKDLQAITGATNEEVALMGNKIQEVAGNTKFSTIEVAEGMKILGQAGLSARESIDTIDSVANLATGTLTEMGTAVDLVTTAMVTFNIQAEDSGRIADVFANAVNKSKLDVEKLRTALNYVGPVAEDAKMSLEETAAAMMTLSNSGLKASTIGTGLRRVISELVDPSDKLAKAAARVGIPVEALDPTMHSFTDVLYNLGIVLQDTQTAFDVFGKYGAGSAMALVNDMDTGFNKMLKSTEQFGTSVAMAQKQMEGLAASFKNMKDKFGLVAIALGQAGGSGALKFLIDSARMLADTLIWLVNNAIRPLTDSLAPVFKMFGWLVAPVVAVTGVFFTLKGAIFLLHKWFGLLISLKFSAFFATLRVGAISSAFATTTLSTSLKELFMTMNAHPIMALVTALGLAVAYFYGLEKGADQLIETYERFRSEMEKSKSDLKGFVKELERLEEAQATDDDLYEFVEKLVGVFPELSAKAYLASQNIDELKKVLSEALKEKEELATMKALTEGLEGYAKKAEQVTKELAELHGKRWSLFPLMNSNEIAAERLKLEAEFKKIVPSIAKIIMDAKQMGKDVNMESLFPNLLAGGGDTGGATVIDNPLKTAVMDYIDQVQRAFNERTETFTLEQFGFDKKLVEELDKGTSIAQRYLSGQIGDLQRFGEAFNKVDRKTIEDWLNTLQEYLAEARKMASTLKGDDLYKAQREWGDKIRKHLAIQQDGQLKDASVYHLKQAVLSEEASRKEQDQLNKALKAKEITVQQFEKKMAEQYSSDMDKLQRIMNKGLDPKGMIAAHKLYMEEVESDLAKLQTDLASLEARGKYTAPEAAKARAALEVNANGLILSSAEALHTTISEYKKAEIEDVRASQKLQEQAYQNHQKSQIELIRSGSEQRVDIVEREIKQIKDLQKQEESLINSQMNSGNPENDVAPDVGENAIRQSKIMALEKEIELRKALRDSYSEFGKENVKYIEFDQKVNALEAEKAELLNQTTAAMVTQKKAMQDLQSQADIDKMEFQANLVWAYPSQNVPDEQTDLKKLQEEFAIRQKMWAAEEQRAEAHAKFLESKGRKEEAREAMDSYYKLQQEHAIADLNFQKQIAAEELAVIEDLWSRGKASAEEYGVAIENAMKKGVISARAARDQILASTNDMSKAFEMGWNRSIEQSKSMGELMADMAGNIRTALTDGVVDALMDVSDGTKTAKEAFMDLGKSIIKMIAQISTKMAMLYLFGGKGQAGVFDIFGSFADGGEIPGRSPNKKADNIPIMATAGEYMQPVDTVQHYGKWVMDALRQKLIPKELFEAFRNKRMSVMDKMSVSAARPSNVLASGGPVGAPSSVTNNLSVPVTVSGLSNEQRLAAMLQEGVEYMVMSILKREFSK